MGLSRRKADGKRKKTSRSGDIVEISPQAKNLNSYAIRSNEKVSDSKTTPGTAREEKIRKVKERIEKDFYHNKEIYSIVAEKLLKLFGL